MSNLSILNGHDISEIYYYTLSIEVDDSKTDTTSNTPSEIGLYSSNGYVIDNYDINIIVNENNTFDITETITAYFNTPKHGIIRTIPLRNEISRLDGTITKNRVQITNVSVDDTFSKSKNSNDYTIKIGNANRTLTGKKTYVIKYTYNLGKDPMKNYDELYYNIIGTEWDTYIGNVTFTITMPKSFNSSKLGFSSGFKGSTDNSNIKYNVVGNKITGNYDGILKPGEGLTVRCELEEGYFKNAKLAFNYFYIIIFLLPLSFLGISIYWWNKYGRDDLVVKTVEF